MIQTTAIISDLTLDYPRHSPFNPDIHYPEYPFSDLNSERNTVYQNIRQLLYQLDFDSEHYGQKCWNPFGKFIKPGYHVVIKPNWVNHFNPVEDNLDALISHSSVIRVILDYVLIALKGEGKIVIGDAPIQSCNFNILTERNVINEIVNTIQPLTAVRIEVKDFRKEIMVSGSGTFRRIKNCENNFVPVNLGKFSLLNDRILKYHNEEDHTYLIAEEILKADAIIEIPKLKTHRKAGITCCLKNNVGINAIKDCLVHHRKGSITEGGDAYIKRNIGEQVREALSEKYFKTEQRVFQLFYKVLLRFHKKIFINRNKQNASEGNWYGNDTVWRMIHDLNKIVFYADLKGSIKSTVQRSVMYIVDGVIGGEGEGPLKPISISSGIIAFGSDPLLIDACMASIMGFDINKIPSINRALKNSLLGYGITQLLNEKILINGEIIPFEKIETKCKFLPSEGWQNHIEK
jgi:uncharacterized protein (DUF362 family)